MSKAMSISPQELEEFKCEALELIEVAEKNLLAINCGAEFKATFETVFRCFHNLKGAAGMMELHQLQSHVHELETALMPFKEKTDMLKERVDFFLKGIDGARHLLDGKEVPRTLVLEVPIELTAPAEPKVLSVQESYPIAAVEEFIAEGEEIVERISTKLQLIEAGNSEKEILDHVYRDIHSLKGAAFLFNFNIIGDFAHSMESSMEPVRNGTHLPNKSLLNWLFKALKCIEMELSAIKKNTGNKENVLLLPIITSALTTATLKLEPAASLSPELIVIAEQTQNLQPEKAEIKVDELTQPTESAPKDNESAGSIRVSVALLDNLMTLMGEMVLIRNQVLQFSNESEDLEFLNLSKRLNGVTSEIQGEMMKTRMQPIGNILTKFHRVVRDLSQELKKDISLSITGADTELDKSLLEAIKDPLTHIIRNSCDHGIETPEIRKNLGKTSGGTISVKSYHEGGQVVIEVSDDGKGLNKSTLLKKALEKGIIDKNQADLMGEKEIFNLIFAPGFSTAASVTNISGRGVGMDVVRTNVEKIGGSVELNSAAEKGTSIKLKIPLTLAIVPALIVKSENGTFAIPQVRLEELVRVDPQSSNPKIEYLHNTPVYRLRGNILPLINLNQVLSKVENKKNFMKETENSVCNIAVLNADQCSFGLIIDEIQDTADIVVKPINRLLKSLQVYSGATILGDGSIALILDVQGIAKVTRLGTEEVAAVQRKLSVQNENRTFELQDFLIVRLNSPTKHAIVLNYVHRLEEFKRSAIEYSSGQAVIRYGESILPIISVSEQLGFPKVLAEKSKDTLSVVVIKKSGLLFGLEVDEIVDTFSTEADVDTTFARQSGIYGNINTQSELIVAVDPFQLIDMAYPELSVTVLSATTKSSMEGLVSTQLPEKKLNILFVEDTAFFRKAVTIVLEKLGHIVSLAFDGKEALGVLLQNPEKFDLVISDIEMPHMNGFQLAQAIRADAALKHLPLLALSSRAEKKYCDLGKEAGFDLYLEKLKPDVLVLAISRLTQNLRRAA